MPSRADLELEARNNESLKPEDFKTTVEWVTTASNEWSKVMTNEKKLSMGAKRFPWILKNRKRKQLMYDWELAFVNETIDPYYAQRWYEDNAKYQRDIKEQFFWSYEVFTFYMLNKHDPEDPDDNNIEIPEWATQITTEFAEYLWLLAANRILKEKNFRAWQHILQLYDIYEIKNPDPLPNNHFFVRKQGTYNTNIKSDWVNKMERLIHTPDDFTKPEIKKFFIENDPEIYKTYTHIMDTYDKDTKSHKAWDTIWAASYKRDKDLERLMNKANKRYTTITKPVSDKRELQPLKEALNYTAIAWMSITEIQELCAMKDFLEWRIKFKPQILKWKLISQPYQNIELTTQFNEDPQSISYKQPIKLYWHYTSSVRFAMFWEEKYYKRIRPWQTLQPRQWIAKLYTWWVTSVVAARRSWKSYRAIDEAVEMFTADTQERSKPIRVLFVGINTKKLKTVVKYLLSFTKAFTQAWYFDWEASKNIMHYRKKESNKKATDADDLWTIEFIWSKDEDAWVWDYADLIIIDECERIDENVWEDIMPIITNEWARCILISTLNKFSQKTWFYNQLVQWETEELQRDLMKQDVVTIIRSMWAKRVQPTIDKVTQIQEETWKEVPFEEWINWIDIDAMSSEMRYKRQRVWLRFTGEDNDLKTEKEKSFARDRLRWTKSYYPERRAIFPEDTWVYDYESSIKDTNYFSWRQYKYVVLAYDPAESKDKAALVYMWYDWIWHKIEIFKTVKLPNNYTYHWPLIANSLKECERFVDRSQNENVEVANRVFFAYDFNGVWQWLEPFFQECWVRIDLKVRFTWQWWITKKWINHNVPKELLVNMLQNTMDHWAMIINQECQEFIEELDHYKSYYNPDTGNTKYQAEHGASDDFVSAAMIGTYFILEYMWEKFNITKNEIEQIIDSDANMNSVESMFDEVERIVMQGVNSWKTVQQVIDEYNGRSQRNNLKRKDVLSQFGY